MTSLVRAYFARYVAATVILGERSREDAESAKGLQGGLVAKNAELLEKTLVLEAKIADLKGERSQLKDEIKRVNKALDRMRWSVKSNGACTFLHQPGCVLDGTTERTQHPCSFPPRQLAPASTCDCLLQNADKRSILMTSCNTTGPPARFCQTSSA